MINFKSVKTQLIIYLLAFALFLSFRDKNFAFLGTAMICLIAACALDSFILYLKTKTLQLTESSAITGLIIGYVLAADEPWWIFALAAILAILSKHIIRFQKRHIFNPAAFGLFLTLIIFGASTEWKGTYVWYIVAPAGAYFAYKVRKIELLAAYFLTAIILFGTQALLNRVSLAGVFGYLSYFYIFVMAVEPKTTPVKLPGKYLFGACLAALIFILTQIGARFDVELLSLLAMNVATPFLNKIPVKKGGAA